ncbi:MAG: hypothetical protein D3911_02965 [Candidatus Electrothrix sp. AW3_4]|nr:hypothetical protein [Candidatus Electrothrix gigas]
MTTYKVLHFNKINRLLGSVKITHIILVALLVRTVWALLIPVSPVSDSHAYDTFARNIASGHGYGWLPTEPIATWAVGTSAIYAVFYKIFGVNYLPIVIFNIFLGTGITILVFTLASHWFGDLSGVIAGLIIALCPGQVMFTTVLASELIFEFLILLAMYTFLIYSTEIIKKSVLTGVLLASATYVRTVGLLLPAVFGLIFYLQNKKLKTTIYCIGIIFLTMFVLISPWSYRNYKVFNRIILISSNSGTVLWMGNNPETDGGYMQIPKFDRVMDQPQQDHVLGKIAKQYITDNPVEFIFRSLKKILKLHKSDTIGVTWNSKSIVSRFGSGMLIPLKLLSAVFWITMLALGLIGLYIQYIKQGIMGLASHPAALCWLYFTGIHAVFIDSQRYHYPSVPFIAVLASLTLSEILVWSGKHSEASSAS